ncbi:MAG: hypothetical protein AAFY88_25640, partial [Acidobacteriota bacterium]
APGAPTLTSVSTFTQLVIVNWQDAAGVVPESYGVWRSTESGGPYEEIARVARDIDGTTSYSDSLDAPPTVPSLYYVIVAYGAGDEVSSPSNEGEAVFQFIPTSTVQLVYPTPSSRVFETGESQQALVGWAEPGSAVQIERGGVTVATATSASSLTSESAFISCPTVIERPWPSYDGRYLWGDCTDSHFLVDFEAPGGVESQTLEAFGLGTARWLPYSHSVLFTSGTGDVTRYDVETGGSQLLLSGDIALAQALPSDDPAAASDGSELIVQARRPEGDGFYRVELGDGGETWTLLHDLGATYDDVITESVEVSPPGRHLSWVYNQELRLLEIATGAVTTITTVHWDFVMPSWSWDGESLAYVLRESFFRELWIYNVADGTSDKSTDFAYQFGSFAPWGDQFGAFVGGEGFFITVMDLVVSRAEVVQQGPGLAAVTEFNPVETVALGTPSL